TMLDWAEALGLPTLLLLTKADKVSRNEAARQRRRVAAEVPATAGVIVFSAQTGQGVDDARACLDRWFDGASGPDDAAKEGDEAPAGHKKRPRGGTAGPV